LYISNIKKYLVAFVCLLTSLIALAQDPQYTTIDKSKGLPSNAIYDIYQDSKGFMWFTCDKGLVRYDGFEFKTFSSKLQSSKSGSNIKEDTFGRIWYQNFDGYLFYVENDSLRALKQNIPLGYMNYGILSTNLFVVQKKGVDVFDLKTLKFRKLLSSHVEFISYTVCDSNNYYLYENDSMHIISSDLRMKYIAIPSYLAKNGISKMLNTTKNILIYGRSHSNNEECYEIKNNVIVPKFGVKADDVQNASYTGDRFWFCV
jgi:hypothetical protein